MGNRLCGHRRQQAPPLPLLLWQRVRARRRWKSAVRRITKILLPRKVWASLGLYLQNREIRNLVVMDSSGSAESSSGRTELEGDVEFDMDVHKQSMNDLLAMGLGVDPSLSNLAYDLLGMAAEERERSPSTPQVIERLQTEMEFVRLSMNNPSIRSSPENLYKAGRYLSTSAALVATLRGGRTVSETGFIPRGDGQRRALVEIMDRSIEGIVNEMSPEPGPTLSHQVALLLHHSRPDNLPPLGTEPVEETSRRPDHFGHACLPEPKSANVVAFQAPSNPPQTPKRHANYRPILTPSPQGSAVSAYEEMFHYDEMLRRAVADSLLTFQQQQPKDSSSDSISSNASPELRAKLKLAKAKAEASRAQLELLELESEAAAARSSKTPSLIAADEMHAAPLKFPSGVPVVPTSVGAPAKSSDQELAESLRAQLAELERRIASAPARPSAALPIANLPVPPSLIPPPTTSKVEELSELLKGKEPDKIVVPAAMPEIGKYRLFRQAVEVNCVGVCPRPQECIEFLSVLDKPNVSIPDLLNSVPKNMTRIDVLLGCALQLILKGASGERISNRLQEVEDEHGKNARCSGRVLLFLFDQEYGYEEREAKAGYLSELLKLRLMSNDWNGLESWINRYEFLLTRLKGSSEAPSELILCTLIEDAMEKPLNHLISSDFAVWRRATGEEATARYLITKLKEACSRNRLRNARTRLAAPAPKAEPKQQGNQGGTNNQGGPKPPPKPPGPSAQLAAPAPAKHAKERARSKSVGKGDKYCFAFAKGSCSNGDRCSYSHVIPTAVAKSSADKDKTKLPLAKVPCKFHAKGSCNQGENCRFSHVFAKAGVALLSLATMVQSVFVPESCDVLSTFSDSRFLRDQRTPLLACPAFSDYNKSNKCFSFSQSVPVWEVLDEWDQTWVAPKFNLHQSELLSPLSNKFGIDLFSSPDSVLEKPSVAVDVARIVAHELQPANADQSIHALPSWAVDSGTAEHLCPEPDKNAKVQKVDEIHFHTALGFTVSDKATGTKLPFVNRSARILDKSPHALSLGKLCRLDGFSFT